MKDKEFQIKLENILKTFYEIDNDVKRHIEREKSGAKSNDYKKGPYYNHLTILEDKYKNKNSDGK